MDYQASIKSLLKEAREGYTYKQVGKGYRVLAKIALFPLILMEIFLIFGYYVQLFFYNALMSPVNYLEDWQDAKKNGVEHATQAVIFFVSTPFIFFLRVLLSFMSLTFFFMWFLLMCCTYLVSLGGVKWQPCINVTEFSKNKAKKVNVTAIERFILTAFIGIVLVVLVCFLLFICGVYQLASTYSVLDAVYAGIILVVNPFVSALAKECDVELKQDAETEENRLKNLSQTNKKTPFQNFVFASLMWGLVGVLMFILALTYNGIDMFNGFYKANNGLAFMSIVLMLFGGVVGLVCVGRSSELRSNIFLLLDAKTLIAGILVAVYLLGSAFGCVQYMRYAIETTGIFTQHITESDAINISMESTTVQNEIRSTFHSYYTPEYTSSTAVEMSNGDWEVQLVGEINDNYFRAFVTVDKNGDVISVYVYR